MSEAGTTDATALLRAEVLRTNLVGDVCLTQNVRNQNNLAGGYGGLGNCQLTIS